MKEIRLVPVYDRQGRIILYDRFIDGLWIGSRSTLEQAVENLSHAALARATHHTPPFTLQER